MSSHRCLRQIEEKNDWLTLIWCSKHASRTEWKRCVLILKRRLQVSMSRRVANRREEEKNTKYVRVSTMDASFKSQDKKTPSTGRRLNTAESFDTDAPSVWLFAKLGCNQHGRISQKNDCFVMKNQKWISWKIESKTFFNSLKFSGSYN